MNIHWLQHVPFEGLGCIRRWAERNGHTLVCSRLWARDKLPDPGNISMLIIMGGPMGANDEHRFPWLREEKDFIARVVDRNIPILGVCLGAQLLAAVLGAKVHKNREKEIGWFPVWWAGTVRSSFSALFPKKIEALHWHGDTFDIPLGATLLASSEACRNQAFVAGDRMLGLQYHLEMTPAGLFDIISHCREELVEGTWIQSEDEIIQKSKRLTDNNAHMFMILEYFENLLGN